MLLHLMLTDTAQIHLPHTPESNLNIADFLAVLALRKRQKDEVGIIIFSKCASSKVDIEISDKLYVYKIGIVKFNQIGLIGGIKPNLNTHLFCSV